jgi:hypothetical protein
MNNNYIAIKYGIHFGVDVFDYEDICNLLYNDKNHINDYFFLIIQNKIID